MPAKGQFKHATPEATLWSQVVYGDVDGCWEWVGSGQKYGWGSFAGEMEGAHRMAWRLTNGPIPDGLYVLHHCDNPRCCRPSHLFLGTQKTNMDDMWAKDRGSRVGPPAARGESHHLAALTEDDVRAIRARYESEEASQTALARGFGITQSNVSCIVNRKSWRHV